MSRWMRGTAWCALLICKGLRFFVFFLVFQVGRGSRVERTKLLTHRLRLNEFFSHLVKAQI